MPVRRGWPVLQVLVVAVACLWLSPLDTRTAFSAASEHARTTGFGPYHSLVFPHVHQRPFEVCPDAEPRHVQMLDRIERALPAIEARSRFEVVRLFHLIRTFNRESQTFYASPCGAPWSYYYTYVDYQSSFMKVAPVIWVIDALHRSEIYIVIVMIAGSWFGIFCLFWTTKRLAKSLLVGFASLAALWFTLRYFGPGLYTDFRLNLFNTFALVGIAHFLCVAPAPTSRVRAWALDIGAAVVFAVYTLLLIFPRLSPTKLDATVATLCVFAVSAVRRDFTVLRRAVLVVIVVAIVQWPYNRFSSRLLGPVSPVNTAAADEFKLVSAVQFLTERPTHFGNFILDFNFTWMFDGDHYLRRLSPVYALHHGYPYWGRRFLRETVLHHPMELLNAWWKRFAIQVMYHRELSYGMYGNRPTAGAVVLWTSLVLACILLACGGRLSAMWPLMGVIFWEVFGLQTFLALMHVHNIYIVKGVAMLWCVLPCAAVVAFRERVAFSRRCHPIRVPEPLQRARRRYLAIGAVVGVVLSILAARFVIREFRKEIRVTRVWRAIHVGQYHRSAYLSPDALVAEVDAIRAFGGDDPGTVSMYGAWALFGYLERLNSYKAVSGEHIAPDYVRSLQVALYKRGLREGRDNPHFYEYALYLDPDWPLVFRQGIDKFADHPYAALLSWSLANGVLPMTAAEIAHYREVYETAVRNQLHASASLRPGFRILPAVIAPKPPIQIPDGLFISVLPNEVVSIEPVRTLGTDRLTIGAFVRVMYGELRVRLGGQPGARLVEGAALTRFDPIAYRAWHFEKLEASPLAKGATTSVELQAGPEGAAFVLRDFYPLIENPRWFR